MILFNFSHKLVLIFFLLFLFIAGCSGADSTGLAKPQSGEAFSFQVEQLAEGLENPWGMAFLPDGRVLITERPGRLRIWANGKLLAEPVQGIPDSWANGQGGLLDVVLHPDYEQNGWIYLAYAKRGNGNSGNTAISREKLIGNTFTEVELLFHGQPHTSGGAHFGSRIVFDDAGYLYFSIGDRGQMNNAQNLSNHNGKILRIHADGSVPQDNPFVNHASAKPEIWTYGNRNIQGMDIHPDTREIWSHEHGPRGGDEINLMRKAANYGWPKVTHGINYNGTTITKHTSMEGMEDPILYWTPSIAPCGMTFVNSELYPDWKNNILVGALAGTHIHRVVLNENNEVIHTEKLLEGMARFRDVRQGSDGYIYVLTESPGLFFRLIPD